MALDTEILGATENQVVLEIRSHRRMTADTVDHLARAGITHLLPNRMGKLALILMTAGADRVTVSSEHGKLIGTVNVMALGAEPGILMTVKLGIIVGHGIGMTVSADLTLSAKQHFPVVGRMGRMTTGTGIPRRTGQMTVNLIHLIGYRSVTAQTDRRAVLLLAATVAIVAAFGKGSMQNITDQTFPVTAMGAVTGQAICHRGRIVRVPSRDRTGRVAGETDLVRFVLQQLVELRLMGSMTGKTLALSIGSMGVFEFFRQFFMAPIAGFRQLIAQQSLPAAGMGLMTGQTLAGANRRMNGSLAESFLFPLMTFIAEISPFPVQQPLEMGDMGIVTAVALAVAQWLMDDRVGEFFLFMTIEACGFRGRMPGQNKDSEHDKAKQTTMR